MKGPTTTAKFIERNAVHSLPAGELQRKLERANKEDRQLRVKLGIDPTAPDIHLGHTVVLQKLREFQDAGHKVVLIIGDFTARIGDPSGQSSSRPVVTVPEIEANATTYQEQAHKVLKADRLETRFNSEWLGELSLDDPKNKDEPEETLFHLMRLVTVAQILERDDFEKRFLEKQPIRLLELVYPLLQAYDSVAVKADVELGGTDQKFNLLMGREIQQAMGQPSQAILTMPILPGTDGKLRMSKSTGNYIGITEPPEEIFGKVMSIPDEVMALYYDLLLGEPVEPIDDPNAAKRRLARKIVERYHDPRSAVAAEAHFNRLHVEKAMPEQIDVVAVLPDDFEPGQEVHLPWVISKTFGLSTSEVRRLMDQGGVYIDGAVTTVYGFMPQDGQVLQVGKRRFAIFKIEDR